MQGDCRQSATAVQVRVPLPNEGTRPAATGAEAGTRGNETRSHRTRRRTSPAMGARETVEPYSIPAPAGNFAERRVVVKQENRRCLLIPEKCEGSAPA